MKWMKSLGLGLRQSSQQHRRLFSRYTRGHFQCYKHGAMGNRRLSSLEGRRGVDSGILFASGCHFDTETPDQSYSVVISVLLTVPHPITTLIPSHFPIILTVFSFPFPFPLPTFYQPPVLAREPMDNKTSLHHPSPFSSRLRKTQAGRSVRASPLAPDAACAASLRSARASARRPRCIRARRGKS